MESEVTRGFRAPAGDDGGGLAVASRYGTICIRIYHKRAPTAEAPALNNLEPKYKYKYKYVHEFSTYLGIMSVEALCLELPQCQQH
jgi:hypothetical protein